MLFCLLFHYKSNRNSFKFKSWEIQKSTKAKSITQSPIINRQPGNSYLAVVLPTSGFLSSLPSFISSFLQSTFDNMCFVKRTNAHGYIFFQESFHSHPSFTFHKKITLKISIRCLTSKTIFKSILQIEQTSFKQDKKWVKFPHYQMEWPFLSSRQHCCTQCISIHSWIFGPVRVLCH